MRQKLVSHGTIMKIPSFYLVLYLLHYILLKALYCAGAFCMLFIHATAHSLAELLLSILFRRLYLARSLLPQTIH